MNFKPVKIAPRTVFAWLSVIAAAAVLVVTTAIWYKNLPQPKTRSASDLPPVIDLTWTPLGPVSLEELKGRLTIRDDNALDFTTYRFRLIELDKTIDMPIEGVIGREYESDIYLSLLAGDPRLVGLDRLTVEISIADDRGQMTTISRVIRLKPAKPQPIEIKLDTINLEVD